MIPQVSASGGHSFKGAFSYLLHDKRPEGAELHPTTAARVDWTETRNLMTDGPHTACRIMIATAARADELKREAGVKATGRKQTTGAVFSYSLSWSAEKETPPDRAEMIRAADLSLKALKADHLQAVIICHTDTKNPHVHIVVNRVDPSTGKLYTSNDRVLLSRFRERYERERGEIVTKQRGDRAAPAFEKAAKPAHAQELKPEAKAAPGLAPGQKPTAPARPPSQASMLKELGDAQKARHKEEWQRLAAASKAIRAKVYAAAPRFVDIIAQHKAETRPLWSELGKSQREEKRAFLERDKRITGKVVNAIAAVTQRQIRGDGTDRGFLTMAFAFTLSKQARHAAFADHQRREKDALGATVKAQLDGKIQAVKAQQADRMTATRDALAKTRADLIARQNDERAKIREAWKQIYDRRGQKQPQPVRSVSRRPEAEQQRRAELATRRTAQTTERDRQTARLDAAAYRDRRRAPMPARPTPETPTMERDFDKARQLPIANIPTAPVKQQAIPTPTPQPTPAGVPAPAPRVVQTVPKVDRAAEWAKSAQGRRELEKDAPAPAAGRAFDTSASPAQPAQPATEQKPMSRADYWNQRAQENAADRQQEPARDRSRDRDFDRER